MGTTTSADLKPEVPRSSLSIAGDTELYGQLNLTGDVDPIRAETDGHSAEAGWLFDPDWGLVLAENVAGKEIVVDQGISLAFPAGHIH
jgi:hypothetical protein